MSHRHAYGLFAAALAFAGLAAAPAHAAYVTIYTVPGVEDDGGAIHAGVATILTCTNLSASQQNFHFVVHDASGAVVSSKTTFIVPKGTLSVATHLASVQINQFNLATGFVAGGYAVISATTSTAACTASVVDAASAKPSGIALHMQ